MVFSGRGVEGRCWAAWSLACRAWVVGLAVVGLGVFIEMGMRYLTGNRFLGFTAQISKVNHTQSHLNLA